VSSAIFGWEHVVSRFTGTFLFIVLFVGVVCVWVVKVLVFVWDVW